MENPRFEAVCARLKQALKINSDAALAKELDFSPQAFANRKKVGKLPEVEVEELVRRRGLNLEWVNTGDGPMYASELMPEQDLQRLRVQLEAMQLHKAALDLLEPVLAGVLSGDKELVESAIQRALSMTPDEAEVLRAYRRAAPDVREAMSTLSRAVDAAITARGAGVEARQSRGSTHIHGKVGQQLTGDQTVHGPMTINVGGKKR